MTLAIIKKDTNECVFVIGEKGEMIGSSEYRYAFVENPKFFNIYGRLYLDETQERGENNKDGYLHFDLNDVDNFEDDEVEGD